MSNRKEILGVSFAGAVVPQMKELLQRIELLNPSKLYIVEYKAKKQIRAAHQKEPGKRGKWVFVCIDASHSGASIDPPASLRLRKTYRLPDNPVEEVYQAVKDWHKQVRPNQPPNAEMDYGDGRALSGGQIESNRRRH